MNFARTIRIQKLQNKNRMIGKSFSILDKNERRRKPWLGAVWFEPGMDEKRKEFIKEWSETTKRLLKENPNLKIIG